MLAASDGKQIETKQIETLRINLKKNLVKTTNDDRFAMRNGCSHNYQSWKNGKRRTESSIFQSVIWISAKQHAIFSLSHLYSLHTIQGSDSETKSCLILAIRQKMNEENRIYILIKTLKL